MSRKKTEPAKRELKPREGLIEVVEQRYMVTGLGLAHIQQMAALGCGKTEIAEYLKVNHAWMSRACNPESEQYDPQVHESFLEGESEFKQRLRRHQLELSEHNATMAVHLGKQYLGQKDQVQEHHHVHQVVGTMPDYDKTSDEWKKQFAPTGVLRIEDAQVLEIDHETSERDEEGDRDDS